MRAFRHPSEPPPKKPPEWVPIRRPFDPEELKELPPLPPAPGT